MDAQGSERRGVDLTSTELPPSLPAWFPFLWRRVLFPGTRPVEEALPSPLPLSPWGRGVGVRGTLLWLLLLPAVLLYPCLSFDLFEPDESRYAQIPREMLARGERVVPSLQGEPYLDKPPLFYWLVMGSYRVFGVSPGAARLVPALALHLCVLFVYLLGR